MNNKLLGGFLAVVAWAIIMTCVYAWLKKDEQIPKRGAPIFLSVYGNDTLVIESDTVIYVNPKPATKTIIITIK